MAEHSLASLYRALQTQLKASGTEVWQTRIYADQIPAKIVRPYALYKWSGGGELNIIKRSHVAYMVDVKVVCEDLPTALTGAGRIVDLLRDRGVQDTPFHPTTSPVLAGGTDWLILTSTRDITIHLQENIESGAKQLYHEGARFKIRMERI